MRSSEAPLIACIQKQELNSPSYIEFDKDDKDELVQAGVPIQLDWLYHFSTLQYLPLLAGGESRVLRAISIEGGALEYYI